MAGFFLFFAQRNIILVLFNTFKWFTCNQVLRSLKVVAPFRNILNTLFNISIFSSRTNFSKVFLLKKLKQSVTDNPPWENCLFPVVDVVEGRVGSARKSVFGKWLWNNTKRYRSIFNCFAELPYNVKYTF